LTTLAIIFGSLLLVALWEFFSPRRLREFPALRRRVGNIGFWVLNLFLVAFFLPPASAGRLHLEAAGFPVWPIRDFGLSFLAGFLLLDLLRYAVHRCEHAVPLFWRFHALHHSDPDVDVTTSVRHHPVEYLLASAVYWTAVLVLGVPAIVVLSYGATVFATAAIQHGNIRLPEKLDRWMQPVLVTVDIHRLHHSVVFDQANSNYGAVFSVWDRLFGTYTSITRPQHDRIVFGVRELPPRECLKPSAMMLTPWLLSRAKRSRCPDATESADSPPIARSGSRGRRRAAPRGR
jgi:sterol desaturase/sphingolipid hydroxylase (fatty acid hydroxylase superfamily)